MKGKKILFVGSKSFDDEENSCGIELTKEILERITNFLNPEQIQYVITPNLNSKRGEMIKELCAKQKIPQGIFPASPEIWGSNDTLRKRNEYIFRISDKIVLLWDGNQTDDVFKLMETCNRSGKPALVITVSNDDMPKVKYHFISSYEYWMELGVQGKKYADMALSFHSFRKVKKFNEKNFIISEE